MTLSNKKMGQLNWFEESIIVKLVYLIYIILLLLVKMNIMTCITCMHNIMQP